MTKKQNVIVLGTNAKTLNDLRGDLVKSLLDKGLHTVLASSKPNFGDLDFFENFKNFEYCTIQLKRNSLSLYNDIKTLVDIFLLVKKFKPRFVLAYGIKLVIWGGLASTISKTQFYALITGVGFAFHGETFKRKLLTKFVIFLYRVALKNSKAIIFQNKDNLNLFVNKGIVPRSKTHIVNGSGVNIKKFKFSTIPKGNIHFLCVSRLLNEKGLREYAAAAKIVKYKFPDVVFNLVGPEDSSHDAISLVDVTSWSNYINYKGSTKDVRTHIKNSHVFVLPSYHEGLPRSTLEAMSVGRPILTTDAVGCKDTVQNGINGFKVPVGSIDKLAEKMVWFIENTNQIGIMGVESRRIVLEKFNVHKVNEKMLKIMEL